MEGQTSHVLRIGSEIRSSWVVMDDYEPKLESLAGKIWENVRQDFLFSLRIYLSNILGLEVQNTIFWDRLESVCVFSSDHLLQCLLRKH
jgi:hypothetical protein